MGMLEDDLTEAHREKAPLRVFGSLREANLARQDLWGGDLQDGSYRSNELCGEAGEAMDEALLALMVSVRVGRVANMVKKLERERLGLPGSRAPVALLAKELGDLNICTDLLAAKYGINLDQATADKFNETSVKMGFDVRLHRPADLEPK